MKDEILQKCFAYLFANATCVFSDLVVVVQIKREVNLFFCLSDVNVYGFSSELPSFLFFVNVDRAI